MKQTFLAFAIFLTSIVLSFAQHFDHVQGDLIIQLKPGQKIEQIVAELAKLNGKDTKAQIVEEISPPLRIWLLNFDHKSINELDFLNHLRILPGVQTAQFNHFISIRETTPNDPNFSAQWQWVNTGQGGGTVDADVDADLAWDITTGGTTALGHEIVVCVVEQEGANQNHPDLQGNLWVNAAEIPLNGIDDDNNGYLDDYNGWNVSSDNNNIPSSQHGTQVSGMVGARGNNGLFVSGINWDVKIMHVILGSTNEAKVIAAYTYPLVQRKRFNETSGAQGAFVVATNSSWGIDGGNPADSPLWCSFYDSLGVEGILSCGATANNNVNIDNVLDLPTACPSEYMVAVTATNNKDVRTFSGYGTTHIDVGAPGGGIVTISTNGGPITVSGTSFASPLTAGIIALLYSAPCSNIAEQALSDPSSAALLIRDALFEGVDIIPNLVNETKYGGRVNAFNSLNILLQNCGPCPKPYGIEVSNILDVSVNVNWQSPDSSLHTDLRYRALGAPNWILIQNVSSPFVLQGLQACTDYEMQLEEICDNESSGFANSITFKTEGCCIAPSNLSVTNTSTIAATFSWDPVFAANSFNVNLIDPQGNTLYTNILNNSFLLSGLAPCTEYQVQVQTVCDTGETEFTLPISFTTLGCGSCIDLAYCPSAGQSTQYEWIENVNLGFINNTSGNNNGYGDFTGLSSELITYTSNPITLTPGYSGGSYPEWFTVYIDFNQDGDFNDMGEKAFDTGATISSAITGNIVVPGTAELGSTRMRVIMRWNNAPTGPCAATFPAGEVEDYCISINPGTAPNCTVPNDLMVEDTTANSAELAWEAAPAANDYTLQYRKVGITGWTTVAAANNAFQITSLEACKDYELKVRSNCTGIESDYSGSIFFATKCVNSADETVANQLSLAISPNPFANEIALDFHLDESQLVQFEINDVCGRKMYEKTQFFGAGSHQMMLSLEMAPGVYFLKVRVENGQVSRKIVKL